MDMHTVGHSAGFSVWYCGCCKYLFVSEQNNAVVII